mmetsp:Transcript_108565/g.294396  ORF Transcript_108565/g.294396 Transcript_108565/m.294396 type:complete len:233 (+) Transcript_108565:404-1102(+)
MQHLDVHAGAVFLDGRGSPGRSIQRVAHLGQQPHVGHERLLVLLWPDGQQHAAGAAGELQARGRDGLEESLVRVAAEAGDLAGALHLHADAGVRAAEAQEGEHRGFAGDEFAVLQRDLLRLDRQSQHHPDGELDEIYVEGLGDEGHRAGGSHVALDHLDRPCGARHVLRRHELNVEGPRYHQLLAQLGGDVLHAPFRRDVDLLGGQQQRGVATVRTSVLHMLRYGEVHELAL